MMRFIKINTYVGGSVSHFTLIVSAHLYIYHRRVPPPDQKGDKGQFGFSADVILLIMLYLALIGITKKDISRPGLKRDLCVVVHILRGWA